MIERTNKEIKKIAKAAFKSEFGAEPRLNDIIVLGASKDGTKILFRIGKHVWRFESFATSDGSLWVGDGTLKMER